MPLSKIPGLVLHIPMNEKTGTTASDNSRYGNDGSLGGGTPANMPVWTEHGLRFDGANDYVDCGSSDIFNLDTITLCAWIKRNSQAKAAWEWIVNRRGGVGSEGQYQFGFEENQNKLTLSYENGGWWQLNSNSDVGTDWTFIVITMSNLDYNFYINGTLDKSGTAAVAIESTTGANLRIGCRGNSVMDTFDGSIADIRIYNRALSTAEITDLYDFTRHNYV